MACKEKATFLLKNIVIYLFYSQNIGDYILNINLLFIIILAKLFLVLRLLSVVDITQDSGS